jgi:hypothetical protein
MKSQKPKIGDMVRIVFIDHCSGSGYESGVLEFETFGRIAGITKTHYDICNWGYLPDSRAMADDNCEFVHIVRKAIISIKVLK